MRVHEFEHYKSILIQMEFLLLSFYNVTLTQFYYEQDNGFEKFVKSSVRVILNCHVI